MQSQLMNRLQDHQDYAPDIDCRRGDSLARPRPVFYSPL